MTTDLALAVAHLKAKTKHYSRYFAYYQGHQELVYSTKRMDSIFKNLNARFSENWCAVVIDAVIERIQLRRIMVANDDALTARLDELMNTSELTLESDDAHTAALVAGESYIIAWPDEEGQPDAYYNDPRNVHVFYEAAKPRVKRFAAKWWVGDDEHRYVTLYYANRLEYYRSRNSVTNNEVDSDKSFEPFAPGSAPNEYGVIPVFHFRRDRRTISSELANIIEPQDAVNKLLADMMIAAEFGAFKQRWIISNADVSKLKNAPNEIWSVPSGDGQGQASSVGQFDITPLDNYLQAIDKKITAIAIISRTPKHYFFGQGGDPSGEALIAMEAPLNHKAQKYIDRFTATWSELAAFLLRLDGKGEIADNAIVPVFDKPQTVQPYTQALIRKEAVQAGVPLMWHMAQEGYTEQELAELEEARDADAQRQQATLAQAMTDAQRRFDQNGNDEEGA